MPEGSNKGLVTLNVIQLVIIAILAYLLFDGNKNIVDLKENVATSTEEISELKADILDTRENLEKVREERIALGLSVDSLDNQINEINQVVVQLERKNSISRSEIRKLTSKVSALNENIEQHKQEIAQLTEENQHLVENVDSLSKENTTLSENVQTLSVEKDHLEHDLKIASILTAEGLEITGLKDNDKELGKQPFNGNKLARFKVTFNIGDNKAAKHNKKRFYMRMITPAGKCFSDSRNGGGKFTDHEGHVNEFTMSKELVFENTNQWLSMVMLKGFQYTPGNYIIQIYCEGYDIGQTSFIVK